MKVPVEAINPYAYVVTEPSFDLELKDSNARFRRFVVSFDSALPSGHPEMDTAVGEYFQPNSSGPVPLVILLHGVGKYGAVPCYPLARDLARQGIASFVLLLPVHPRRMPADYRARFPFLSDDEWFAEYRTSVINTLQVLDWAQTRPELTDRRAVIGISFGGFIASLTMGVDRRIGSGVLIVSGGNWERLNWVKREAFGSRYSRTLAEHEQATQAYDKYLSDVTAGGFDGVVAADRSFQTDPYTFTSVIGQRRLLLVNARFDKHFPRQLSREFWQACGRPEVIWLPTGHASIWLFYPLLRRRISRFLGSTLGR